MMGVSRVIGAGGDGFKQDASDFEREREISLYRSGSAPPSIEGSLAAVGGLYTGIGNGDGFMTEEALLSDPAYVSYYYSHLKLNPRMPPPMLSKEDWRMMQQGQGGRGDRRKVRRGDEGGSSLFSMQPGFGLQNEGELEPRKAPGSGEWLPLGRQKSFAEIFQDDLGGTTPISGHSSRPASRSPLPDVDEYGSLDPQLLARAPSPRLPPGVRRDGLDANPNNGSRPFNTVLPTEVESDDILAALSSMSLSNSGAVDAENIAQVKLQQEINDHQNFLFDLKGSQNHKQHLGMSSIPQSAKSLYSDSARRIGGLADLRNATSRPSAPSGASLGRSAPYQNGDGLNSPFISYGSGGYSRQLPSMMDDNFGTANLSPLFGNMAAGSAIPSLGIDSRVHLTGPNDLPNLERIGNLKAASDPLYMQYLKTAGYASDRVDNSYMNLLEVQRACLGAYIQSQEQYGMPFLGKSAALNNGYYDDSSFGMSVTHPGKTRLASPIFPVSPAGPGSPLRHGERNGHFPSGLRSFPGGITGWHSDFNGGMEETFPCSLLEEFKSNKTRCFELCEIAGHVVEFSADQYGSRFIQQKLETATTAEKDMVYEEIMSHALSLMTDVFGNYVVQKFFEHGSSAQVRELANQLNGHVLALSLQMYGCRVIQKAIEVVDLDQKTKMVAELDGHVIRCVRDQNGNHVIQKCIECIPQDSIHFIISTFYDQIVTLSTHPYGCRVVQRMLEYCDSPKTQQIVMKEIMRCVCMLAQDQYGNYVVQHVLEYGKPHERSAIIEKLTGQIVQMSQQKFASNVVEKCLTFCGLEERQTLVKEMLGSTDENEPLQAMMKDQFGNYVVQKVLETCDDQQRELILTRIKIHLNALKKYTYGKHIVARVEKLVAAGERRIGLQNPYPPSRME